MCVKLEIHTPAYTGNVDKKALAKRLHILLVKRLKDYILYTRHHYDNSFKTAKRKYRIEIWKTEVQHTSHLQKL